MIEDLIGPPPQQDNQEQVIVDDHNTLLNQNPDVQSTPVVSVDEIQYDTYKKLSSDKVKVDTYNYLVERLKDSPVVKNNKLKPLQEGESPSSIDDNILERLKYVDLAKLNKSLSEGAKKINKTFVPYKNWGEWNVDDVNNLTNEINLNEVNSKRVVLEKKYGVKTEPFTSIEDYNARAPLMMDAVKKITEAKNTASNKGYFNKTNETLSSLGYKPYESVDEAVKDAKFIKQKLTDFITAKNYVPAPVSDEQKQIDEQNALREKLMKTPPTAAGYGGDIAGTVSRETNAGKIKYELGEAKRKELLNATQMISNAQRLREKNMLPDDQVKILNALQNNSYSGAHIGLGLGQYENKTDEQLSALNNRAGLIAEGNLQEAQQIGVKQKELQKSVQENYISKGITPPPELINQIKQMDSEWQDRVDKSNLFNSALNKGMIEEYGRKAAQGSTVGDYATSLIGGLNSLGKVVVNSIATLKPSDIILPVRVSTEPIFSDKLDKALGYDEEKAKKWITDFNTNNAAGFDHVMYDVMKLSTPEHKEAQNAFSKAISGVLEIAPPMVVSMMANNPYISYSVWAANAYGSRIESMTQDPRWKDASLSEIRAAALPPALVEAAIMEIGVKDAKAATGLGKSGLDQTTRIYDALKYASSKVMPGSGLTGLKSAIVDGVLRTTAGAITAGGTGATVSMVNDLGTNLYNIAMGPVSGLKTERLTDGTYNIIDKDGKVITNEPTEAKAEDWKNRYATVTPTQIIENGVNAAKDWAIGGLIISAPITAGAVIRGRKVNSEQFAFTKSLVEDSGRYNVLISNIKNDLATKKIDKAEAESRIASLNEFKSIADQIPADLTPKNQQTSFELLSNIKKLEAQKAGKNEFLTGGINREIELNRAKLKEIGDAVQDKTKDRKDWEESHLPFTVKDIDNGVNYSMNKSETSNTGGDQPFKGNPEKISQPIELSIETPETEAFLGNKKVDTTSESAPKSDTEIEKRMAEIEGDSKSKDEYNSLEKEMEKRERATVFGVPLDKVNDAVDALMSKEKEKPNGFGSFIDNRDARETKEVADRYLGAKKLTDAELESDFSDAVRGNPTTWYADGLKLRESLKEATNRGIDTQEMLDKVVKVYEDTGYDTKTAKSVVAGMLNPVFEGSQKVNGKQIPEYTPNNQKGLNVVDEKTVPDNKVEVERENKVKEATRPELDLDSLTDEAIKSMSKDATEMATISRERDKIGREFDRLKQIIDCIWKIV